MVADVDSLRRDLFTTKTEVRHALLSSDVQLHLNSLPPKVVHDVPGLLNQVRIEPTAKSAIRSEQQNCSPLHLVRTAKDWVFFTQLRGVQPPYDLV